MNYFNTSSKIFITCNKRLSPYLKKEAEELGFTVQEMIATGIVLKGTLSDCIKLNLNLRCASQVMYSLKAFVCDDPTDLYNAAKQISWETIIPDNGYFSVHSNVYHPSIRTDMFANVKL